MRKKSDALLWAVCIFAISCCLNLTAPGAVVSDKIELASYESDFSNVYVTAAKMGVQAGLAVVFEGTEGLHYYANPKTATSPDLVLKVKAQSQDLQFGQADFPKWKIIKDPEGKKVEVYAGDFTVFVPIKSDISSIDKAAEKNVTVKISGQTCTDQVCLMPFEKALELKVNLADIDKWQQVSLEKNQQAQAVGKNEAVKYSTAAAFVLAFLAGLILNIMPCVLPVIPLKVLSIFQQAKESKSRCIAMGISFCLGILIFFAILAGLNIVLRAGFGSVFQWGDHFRYPQFIIGMAILMVVLALFMFGVFGIAIPSAIGAKEGSGKGYSGSVAMGFLAALLGTPCSFAILTAAFAWAQTQNLLLSTVAIMLIGVGMAAPYALLTSMPGLLKHLPRAGRWTELFKQSMGFVLLLVAAWLILALPKDRLSNVFYFAIILSFCIWMWGSWVTFGTAAVKKWAIRLIALVIVTLSGIWLLSAPKGELLNWQGYDEALIQQAVGQQRPVLMDFTADWCVNCKVVEKVAYTNKQIVELIKQKNVLTIKADTTLKDNPATVALENTYKGNAVPVSVLLLPGRQEPVYLPGIAISEKLKRHLEMLPDKK